MTLFIKKILFRLLGISAYLKTLHIGFYFLYDLGVLKSNPTFKYHYFVKRLIHKGDYVVDLGANLGYFSKIFARCVGSEGKVISIEPVRPFYNTLVWALGKRKNCVIHNYALGTENKMIQMELPKMNGNFRTGLAHVASGPSDKNENYVFETEMVRGSILLKDVPKINYLKCDIEGYEEFVFPEIRGILEKHKPLIQIETGGTQKVVIDKLMFELGYVQYSVYQNKLVKNLPDGAESGDYLFIHSSAESTVLKSLQA